VSLTARFAATAFAATLRRAWPVLVSYGVFSVWGVGCLVASLALTSGGFGVGAGDLAAVVGIVVATAVGHVAGNLLGLLRLRLVVVVVLFTAAFVAATLSGFAVGPVAVFLVVGVLAALGGYLGVASRLDVVASWFPLSFAVGGAIVWMNRHGAVATFTGGAKHAIWDPFTLLCLSGAVFLNLVFLATRHSLSLTVWQEVGRPAGANATPEDAVAVARPGRGSLLVLLVFSVVVLGATALISPYLFRTVPGEGDGDQGTKGDGSTKSDNDGKGDKKTDGKGKGNGKSKGDDEGKGGGQARGDGAGKGDGAKGGGKGGGAKGGAGKGDGAKGGGVKGGGAKGDSGGEGDGQDKGQGEPSSGGGDGSSGDPLGKPSAGAAGDASGEALELGLRLMGYLLVWALALFVLVLVGFPPVRRAFLLRHLERPIWPVSPTTRVMNLWRRALAALAMVDIAPAPGEAPRDFARRAARELSATLGCEAPGLDEAAALVEKIDYAGRGLGAGEEQTMRAAATAVVQAVAAHAGVKRKVAAAWGPAPDVEP
jgi:hypothetical protein